MAGWHCNCGHSYAVGQVSHRIPQHLFTTNNPPSETELNYILPATVEVAQELATLNDDIESLQKTLETLKARCSELEARLLAYKSIISPLRRVPPEIVREIIGWATVGRPVTLDTEEGIWSYSRISHMWRSVVISTPPFWSTIHIIAPSSPIGYDHAIDCVNTILSQTGTHLLSLDFYYSECIETTRHLALQLLELFIQHASQWRKVSLTIPDTPDFVNILNFSKDRVTCLEDLFLELYIYACGFGSDEPVICFRNAPALRRVSFNTPNRTLDSMTDFFPWVQITKYKADMCTCSSWEWEFLQLMPNLLDLQLDGQYILYNKPTSRLVLKKLCRLDLFRSKDFVDCLILPALQDVAVCLEDCEVMIDLIKRSECHITTLTFRQGGGALFTKTGPLVKLFQSLPSLSTLKLFEQPVMIPYLFSVLIRARKQGFSLLPALTELILPAEIERIDALVFFLQQRVDSSSTLPIKSVVFIGPSQPPLPPALLSLQHDGLHISHDLS